MICAQFRFVQRRIFLKGQVRFLIIVLVSFLVKSIRSLVNTTYKGLAYICVFFFVFFLLILMCRLEMKTRSKKRDALGLL
jgi:hypothetical protein